MAGIDATLSILIVLTIIAKSPKAINGRNVYGCRFDQGHGTSLRCRVDLYTEGIVNFAEMGKRIRLDKQHTLADSENADSIIPRITPDRILAARGWAEICLLAEIP